ncbi:MAG: hypothetical protein DYG92_07535 [Leptolyngbya sp. PLA1]|nr:hypothetical protein [Leptolyngbya sp. PLA1]
MILLSELARAEELRQAAGVRETAPEAAPCAGGVMARSAPGVWMNYCVGAGFAGEVTTHDIEGLVDYYACKGIEPRIEVCPFADESLVARTREAGFLIRLFELVLYRPLDPAAPVVAPRDAPAGLRVGPIDPLDTAEVETFVGVSTRGFMPGVDPIPEPFKEAVRTTLRHPRTLGVAAWLGGEMVGCGAMEVAPPVAGLFGLTVREGFRRRGIQQAMLAWRLNHAAARGCSFATIGSRPTSGTLSNVRRMGFEVAYTKATLVRPGPGLTPVAEH